MLGGSSSLPSLTWDASCAKGRELEGSAPAGYAKDLWYVIIFQFWLLLFEYWECVTSSIIGLYPGAVCHWFWVFVQFPFYACFMMGLRGPEPCPACSSQWPCLLYVGLLGVGVVLMLVKLFARRSALVMPDVIDDSYALGECEARYNPTAEAASSRRWPPPPSHMAGAFSSTARLSSGS